jgi:hypothetical protein
MRDRSANEFEKKKRLTTEATESTEENLLIPSSGPPWPPWLLPFFYFIGGTVGLECRARTAREESAE